MLKRKSYFELHLHRKYKMSKLKDKSKEIVNDENRDSNHIDTQNVIAYRKNTEEENEPLKNKKKKKNKNQKAKEIVPIDITFANSKNGGKKDFTVLST